MKPIEARATFTFVDTTSDGALGESVGYIVSRHETPEQARAWCHYAARLNSLIADRDVRGTLLAVEQETGHGHEAR